MRYLFIIILITGFPETLISKKNNKENIKYFSIFSFPDFDYVGKYEDSSTILVSSVYRKSNLKIDTINCFAKMIPNRFDTSLMERFSRHLAALKEPVLYNDSSNYEIYRFTLLRSFRHPIAIRIAKYYNDYRIYWKVCNGAGGFDPGKLKVQKLKKIKKDDWDKFQRMLVLCNYWNLKNIQDCPSLDGSQWILEGKAHNKYLVINKKSPSQKSDFRNCCSFLFNLTDLNTKEQLNY